MIRDLWPVYLCLAAMLIPFVRGNQKVYRQNHPRITRRQWESLREGNR